VSTSPYIIQHSGNCREWTCSPIQQFYSSFTEDAVNSSEQGRTQKGLGKRISNFH
jgi:hypothetical protein